MDPQFLAMDDEDEHSPPSSPGPSTPRRQSDESSTARSEYDGADHLPHGPSTPVRTLDIWHAAAHTNLLVTEGQARTPRYYIANRWVLAGRQADLVLHSGGDKFGPAVGCARFTSIFSRTVTLGLGGAADADDSRISWEAMTRTRAGVHHQWDLSVALPGEASAGRRRRLCWRHTRDVDSTALRYSMQNLQLVECDTGAVLAVFANNGIKSWKKKGKLSLFEAQGEDPEAWERLVLLSAFALVAKLRRRSTVMNGYGS